MKLKYLSYIDVLRAISIIVVILFHLDVELFKGGFIGVDIFFVISGFLITRLIVNEVKETETFNFKKFYLRRIKRLMPSLFLTLLIVFAGSFLIFSPSDFIKATKSIFASSIAVSNFYFLGESGYFDVTSHLKPLLHTWSLAIEEQFYMIFPMLLVFVSKKFNKKAMLTFFGVLFLISFGLTLYTCFNNISESMLSIFSFNKENEIETASAQFFLLPFRMFEFFIGTIFALAPKKEIKNKSLNSGIHLIGIAGIILCSIYFSADNILLPALNVIPCLLIGLLLYIEPPTNLNTLYENKGLIFIGKISYTWYLLHWPIIVFYRYIIDRPFSALEIILLFVISLVLAGLMYTYYENPMRHSKKIFKMNANYVLPYSVLGFIALFFVLKINVTSNNGWLFRISDESRDLYTELESPKDFHLKYYGGKDYKSNGVIGKVKNEKLDYLLIGDSHMPHLLPGFENILNETNSKARFTRFGGLPFKEVQQKNNFKGSASEKFLNRALAKNPDLTVVLSIRWNGRIINSSLLEDGNKISLKIDSLSVEKVANLINDFQERINKKIIVIGNVPERSKKSIPVFEKIMRPTYLNWLFETESSYKINESTLLINTVFKKQLNQKILFIDSPKAFCDEENCINLKGKNIYQSDYQHMTKEGSLRLIDYFKDDIIKYNSK